MRRAATGYRASRKQRKYMARAGARAVAAGLRARARLRTFYRRETEKQRKRRRRAWGLPGARQPAP